MSSEMNFCQVYSFFQRFQFPREKLDFPSHPLPGCSVCSGSNGVGLVSLTLISAGRECVRSKAVTGLAEELAIIP